MNLLTVLLITGLVGLLIVGLIYPKPMLLFAIVTVIFFPQGAIDRDYIVESFIGGIIVISMIGLAANMALHRMRGPLPAGSDRRIYFGFILVLLVNLYLSMAHNENWTAHLTKIGAFWGFILFVKLFYLVIVNDPDYVEKIYKAFVISGLINILLILIAAYDNPGRATSLMGQILTLPLPIVTASLAFNNFIKTRKISLFWVSAFSIVLIAILLTASRGLLLAVLATVLIIGLARRSSLDVPKGLALVPMLIIAVWLGSAFFDRIVSNDAYDTLFARYDELGAATDAFLSSPALGHGIGYKYISDSIELRLLEGTDYIHNMTFFIFTSFGLTGLAILTAYSLYSVRLVWQHRYHDNDLLLLVGASGVGVLVYSLTQAIFFTLAYNLYMAFVMAVGIKARYGK